MSPTTTGIDVPAGIWAEESLTVHVGDRDPVLLPPAGD
jgi:hypothetical protein